METVTLPLPDTLKTFVDAEMASHGYANRADCIQALLWEARKRKARKSVEALIDEALAHGESAECTEEEWDDMWREIQDRHAQRNGNSHEKES